MSDPVAKPQAAGWRELFVPRYAVSLLVITLAVMLHAADATLIATLSPAIVRDIGGIHLLGWTSSLYELGSITAAAASGLLSLRMGLRKSMSIAALVFAAGCAISAVAGSMNGLLLGRLAQGIGGGGMVALSFVAVTVVFPERLMPRALAVVSTVWGLSAFLGPLIGGLMVEHASWRWGFSLFALLAVLLSVWNLLGVAQRDQAEVAESPFPLWRLLWLAAGVVCISSSGVVVHSLYTPLWLIAGLVCLSVFFALDKKRENSRLFPKEAMSLRDPVGAALIMIMSFAMATIAISLYGPLLLTELHGLSELEAGYVIACSAIGWSVAAVLVSGMPVRRDRLMILCGMLALTISVFGLVVVMSRGPVWLIAGIAVIEGAGFGMAWAFILRRCNSLVLEGDRERIASAIATLHRLGYALGAAIIGLVANASGLRVAEGGEQSETLVVTGAQSAAYWVFVGSIPFALVGLYAMVNFLRPRAGVENTR